MTDRAGSLRHPLAWLLLLALLLRLPFAFIPSFAQPDEIFQYLEQAHRFAAGYGIVPWEYDRGIRSWFLPLILSPPVFLFDQLGIAGNGYVAVIRALAVLLSLAVVASFYGIGRAISPTHGLVAGFVGAVWFELVHFSSHTLGEAVSLSVFMPAAWLLFDTRRAAAWKLALAGFLLGVTLLLRFQALPAIAVLALLACGMRIRQAWLSLIGGGLAALLLGATIDVATGTYPFEWVFRNFAVNIGEGVAASFGTDGPHFYFGVMLALWSTSALVIAPLALIGARRYPALFAAAVVHLLAHTLIGHKEYRFILLSNAIFLLFAAIGFTDAMRWIVRDLSERTARLAVAGSLVFWGATSLFLSFGEFYRYRWTENYPALSMTAEAGRVPGLCGVSLRDLLFVWTGGYAYLHQPVPMYQFLGGEAEFRQSMPAFNAVIAPAGAEVPAPFAKRGCADPLWFGNPGKPSIEGGGSMCLYVRPGPCDPAAAVPASRLRSQLPR